MDISIWDDCWVADELGGKITSPRVEGLSKVSELISNGAWNYELICNSPHF